MRPMSALLGALGAMAVTVGAKLMDNPSPGNFIRRAFTSGNVALTVIKDHVYIDGGEMSQKVDVKTIPLDEAHTMMNSTLWFNITSAWSTDKVDIMALDDKPAPKLGRQALWKREDDDTFHVWGGRTVVKLDIDKVKKDTMWKFHASPKGGGEWSNEMPSPSGDFDDMSLPQQAAYITVDNTGFLFGGDVIDDSDPDASVDLLPVKGMITFDLDSKTFTNQPMPASPYETLVGATAEYIPFGPNGQVMILGGYGYTLGTDTRNPEDTCSFGNLTFFDPETREWNWQNTTDDVIPSPRLDHCSFGVKSGDDKYEIFIFGGYNPTNMKTYQDLHVLTLPGFKWTHIDTSDGGLRSGHSCVTTGNRQMISVSGIDTSKDNRWEDEDPFPQSLGVFDMTELEWKDGYDPDAEPYEMLQRIKDWYDEKGDDSVTWSSKKVEDIFKNRHSEDKTNKGAITGGTIGGGTIGGVAGVGLLGVLGWWLMRRRRRAASVSRSRDFDSHGSRTEMDGLSRPREESMGHDEALKPVWTESPEPPRWAEPYGPPELLGRERPRPVEMQVPPAELP